MSDEYSESEVLNTVEDIRRKNNILWMDILRLAIRVAPEEAKAILKEIGLNDRKVTWWLGQL